MDTPACIVQPVTYQLCHEWDRTPGSTKHPPRALTLVLVTRSNGGYSGVQWWIGSWQKIVSAELMLKSEARNHEIHQMRRERSSNWMMKRRRRRSSSSSYRRIRTNIRRQQTGGECAKNISARLCVQAIKSPCSVSCDFFNIARWQRRIEVITVIIFVYLFNLFRLFLLMLLFISVSFWFWGVRT